MCPTPLVIKSSALTKVQLTKPGPARVKPIYLGCIYCLWQPYFHPGWNYGPEYERFFFNPIQNSSLCVFFQEILIGWKIEKSWIEKKCFNLFPTLFFLSLLLLPICRSSNDFFCKHEIGSRHHDDHLDEGNLIEAFAAVINRSDTSLIGPVDAVTPITYLKIRMVVNKISMLLVPDKEQPDFTCSSNKEWIFLFC